jgi:PB1 domain
VYRTHRFPFAGGTGSGCQDRLCNIAVELFNEMYANQPCGSGNQDRLCNIAAELFNEMYANQPCKSFDFLLFYIDCKGDIIHIANDNELIEAFRDCFAGGKTDLRIIACKMK